ncbi:putative ATP-grasp-modified RiPP [Streptomyces sp. Iso 434]|uniref:putative ATP-grasp-modified RiPP n=1 Tax=Streptomyces sp. Iso 434 TaxID=3062272 RepID=UPI00397F92F8
MPITSPHTARPWGAARLAPYPTTTHVPYCKTEIDPLTQLGVALDRHGRVVEMGKHGTSTGTETNTTTSSDGQNNDQGHDQDSDKD